MAKFNLDYYKGADLYSDGDVENEILRLVEEGISYQDIPEEKCSFPVLYHLSSARENILSWYPFDWDSRTLEIGAGCGAITGLLCRKSKEVTAVELSKRRSRINFLRNKEKDNLEIIVGNLNEIPFAKKFDYIILNGVFEYAVMYTEKDRPYESFLNHIAGLLSDKGTLFIAIENRIGLKYLAGAPEDHIGIFGRGLDGYAPKDYARTFTKYELNRIVESCGFAHYRYYYPYPDYKMPSEIFTDETIETGGYGKDYFTFSADRLQFFDEKNMAAAFAKEHVMDRFANSFLLEASRKPFDSGNRIAYVKINDDRAPEFQTATSIEYEKGQKAVYKYALGDSARAHIDSIYRHERYPYDDCFVILKGEKTERGLRYRFLPEDSLRKIIERAVENGQASEVKERLRLFFSESFRHAVKRSDFQNEDFAAVFGTALLPYGEYDCVAPANIDLICDNIFPADEKYSVIDCEWVFDFYVPTAFIIWRNLDALYTAVGQLEQVVPKKEMFAFFGIWDDMETTFADWNKFFVINIVGSGRYGRFSKERIPFSPDETILAWWKETGADLYLNGKLYFDFGKGFSEESMLCCEAKLKEKKFRVAFQLPDRKKVKRVCFLPAERMACKCRVFLESTMERLHPENANFVKDGFDFFIGGNPRYSFVPSDPESKDIVLTGEMEYITKSDMSEYLRRVLDSKSWKFLKFFRTLIGKPLGKAVDI